MTTFEDVGEVPASYVVPSGVLALRIQAWGAAGRPDPASGVVANGGFATGILAVVPGQTIYVSAPSGPGRAADVRTPGRDTLEDRRIVAGAGGGGASNGSGGVGGGLVGGTAITADTNPPGAQATGGTQSSGGARGTSTPQDTGSSGTFGLGGRNTGTATKGGDGGDGWYGGGSGVTVSSPSLRGFGGGGGSSYVGGAGVSKASTQSGVWSGSAKVVITPSDAQPDAPALTSLADGGSIDRAATNRARHIFSDPIPGDSQSVFIRRHRIVGQPTWETFTVFSPNPWFDYEPDSLALGDYERQVMVRDQGGNDSPWSTSGFFTVAASPGGPAITAPINGSTVDQSAILVWSAPEQEAYRVRRVADDAGAPDLGTVYFDTGQVNDADTRSLPLTFAVNNRAEHVQVQIKVDGLWSPWSTVMVTVDYTPPPTPTIELRAEPGTGSLLVEITNPAPTGAQPDAAFNDVWVDDGTGISKRASMIPLNTDWRYWTPKSGRSYAGFIRVTATAANGVTSTAGDI